MDVGLLLLRAAVGALFVGHGAQKLFGWFGGHGLEGTGGFMESLGYRPGKFFAAVGGLTEAAGGLLLLLGLFTPLAVALLIAMMINAIVAVHWQNGLWATEGGFEYPLVLAVVAAALALVGPGAYSLDNSLLGWNGGGWLAVAAIVVGLGMGAASASIRTTEDEPATEEAEPEQAPSRRAA